MRARLALTAALVALMSTPAAPADPILGPGRSQPAEAIAKPAAEAVASATHEPVGRLVAAVEPIPYRFACDITRWEGDVATTSTQLVEGELGDEPVHFEAHSYLIREDSRDVRGGYDCTLEIGHGREQDVSSLAPAGIPVARFERAGHGHSLEGDRIKVGMAWARVERGTLVRGRAIRWEWTASIGEPTATYQHAASCVGVTVQRITNTRPLRTWCEHEEPGEFWRTRPEPPARDPGHDERPRNTVRSTVEQVVPDEIEDVIESIPAGDAIAAAPVPVPLPDPEISLPPVVAVLPAIDPIGAGEEI